MVSVGVVAGDAAELVAGGLGGLAVVVGGLVPGGGAGQRPQFQQGPGCLRAVQVPVADDRAVVGALGTAVVRVQVLDQLRAGRAQRQGPGTGVAVRVTGIIEDVAEGDPGGRHRGQDGRERADRVIAARRHRGAAGDLGDGRPVLLGIMIAAER